MSSGVAHFLAHLLGQHRANLVDQSCRLEKFGHGYLRRTIRDGGVNIPQGIKPC
jgi:hypothetical protein